MPAPTPNSMPSRPAFVHRRPTPAVQPTPAAHGWSDDVDLPVKDVPHLFLDTGIWYSIARSFGHAGTALVETVKGHERNQRIANEVATQPRPDPTTGSQTGAIPGYQLVVSTMERDARQPCPVAVDPRSVQKVQRELIAEAQIRTRSVISTPATRDKHGGEADLIVRGAAHTPGAVIATNDLGASAVAKAHDVASIHFGHIVRAAVRTGFLAKETAQATFETGCSVSGIHGPDRARVLHGGWLES